MKGNQVKLRLIKCKACGADIAKNAKVCPACGAKRKKHPVLVVILVFIGICILAALFGDDGSDNPQKIEPSGTIASLNPSPSPSPEQSIFATGDQVSLNDVAVTFIGCTESAGTQFNTPSDGNVFLVCEFTIENNSEKDIVVSSMLLFEAYVDDYSANINLGATISSDKAQLDGTIAAGKKMNGVIGYEVPKDWTELEVSFTPNFWSGKEITFIATN